MNTCQNENCGIELTNENWRRCDQDWGREYCQPCQRKDESEIDKRLYKKKRIEIIKRLGNKCACCGETNFDLLTFDHIHGGGNQEKKTLRGKSLISKTYQLSLKDLKVKFQCLCYNCNTCKGFFGICLHKIDKENMIKISSIEESKYLASLDKDPERDRKIYRLFLKLEMQHAYGSKCVKCGETEPLFLVLDHIYDTSAYEKKKIGWQVRPGEIINFLKKRGFPAKNSWLQLLCVNCNEIKECNRRKNGNQNKHVIDITKINLDEIYSSIEYKISEEKLLDFKLKATEIYENFYHHKRKSF